MLRVRLVRFGSPALPMRTLAMGLLDLALALLCSPISFKNAKSDKLMAVKLSEGD